MVEDKVESSNEVAKIKTERSDILVRNSSTGSSGRHLHEILTFHFVDSPMLEYKIYLGLTRCIVLSTMRSLDRVDVSFALELDFPVIRKVRHHISVYLYLRSDGAVSHIGDSSRSRLKSGISRKVEFLYILDHILKSQSVGSFTLIVHSTHTTSACLPRMSRQKSVASSIGSG